MHRLKLYNQLEIEQSSTPENTCCTQELSSSDEDINDKERSTLYYISGYVAFKENNGVDLSENLPELSAEGEFLKFVSRGKVSHPPADLFDLSLYYYSFFKSRNPKCCGKVFLEA